MTSLRSKIVTSYGLSIVTLFIFAAVVIADLHHLQHQIVEGEAVKSFLNVTQEIRREEKNLLLYDDPSHYFNLHEYIDTAERLFLNGRQFFLEVASEKELARVEHLLQDYRELLENDLDVSGEPTATKEATIRAIGHDLSMQAKGFSHRQRFILGHTTRVAAWTLVGALLTLILLNIVSALFTVRQIVRPLGALEKQLDAVAEGEEHKLKLVSRDHEIQSFVYHFNNMLGRLRAQQSQLRHHEKAAALGVLVSGVAHELNNPLSNISTSVQLMMEDDGRDGNDMCKMWLSHIDGETERARRIVRRLLDSVRQPETKLKLHSAGELVRSAALLIHRQLPPDVFLHIEDIPEERIRVDRDRMQQVFINLIRNAVDAGAKNIYVIGDVTTWADSRPVNRDHLQGDPSQLRSAPAVMLFHVADDGPGIPSENLAQLFTPFFTTKATGEGTGLGLYLVREIVSEHDGCITVESRLDGGTQFLVWLPMAQEEVS